MLILNGKKFAANVDEFTETLFQPDGTAVGFYKVRKRHIDLFNMQWAHVGTINRHGVLCAATPLPNGKTWYNFATIKEIGEYASYTQSVEEPRAALKEHCGISIPSGIAA